MSGIFLKKINKSFGNTLVLNNVDLEIYEGEFLTLVGPSGCGKSTLLRILAGLESSDSGEVFIGGADMTKVKPADRNLAMVFQSYALYPHLTVSENMLTPLKLRHLSTLERFPLIGPFISREKRNELTERVRKTAKILKLESFLKRKPGQLSGGQRQRAALGRAMVRNPVGFLMDEPLSNLDAALRVHMRSELSELHKALGSTFVYVTHDQAEALTMSNRLAVMMDGNILQLGKPREIYENQSDIRVAEFIGSPKINIFSCNVIKSNQVEICGFKIQGNFQHFMDKKISIGIRPEHLSLTNDRNCIKGIIKHRENLGSDFFMHVESPNIEKRIILRVSPEEALNLQVDAKVNFNFSQKYALFFNSAGKRVEVFDPNNITNKKIA